MRDKEQVTSDGMKVPWGSKGCWIQGAKSGNWTEGWRQGRGRRKWLTEGRRQDCARTEMKEPEDQVTARITGVDIESNKNY